MESVPSVKRSPSLAWRVARTTLLCLAVVASLLTFPEYVPWMVGAWLAIGAAQIFRHRASWPFLAGCALIVLIKRIDWPPSLGVLAAIVVAVIIDEGIWIIRRRPLWPRIHKCVAIGLLSISWLGFVADWHRSAHARATPPASGPIVCLGDSLSAGDGPQGGFPKLLATMVDRPVVDLSQQGITTTHGLKKLPNVLAEAPAIVVIELGGHDYLSGKTRDQVRENLEQMIITCRQSGAAVILMEIPRGFISDPFGGLERELARKHDLELVSDSGVRRPVFWGPFCPPGAWLPKEQWYSEDGLHPNPRGSQMLAEEVAKAVRRLERH